MLDAKQKEETQKKKKRKSVGINEERQLQKKKLKPRKEHWSLTTKMISAQSDPFKPP